MKIYHPDAESHVLLDNLLSPSLVLILSVIAYVKCLRSNMASSYCLALSNHHLFTHWSPDCGPFGTRTSLSNGGGGGWLQRASNPHHPRSRLALLFHQLPLRSQPTASPTEEGVCGKDELQGRSSARQGELEGQNPPTGEILKCKMRLHLYLIL